MNTPFAHLVKRFLQGFFNAGLGFTATLGLLACPGAIIALTIWPKYSELIRFIRKLGAIDPNMHSLGDKYLFVVLSMTVTGIVTVLRWDSLFPDRRDFANLAPLPVSTRSILLAKALALALFGLAFVIDVNLISSMLFPLIALGSNGTFFDVVRYIFAHAIAVGGAGLLTFASFLAITGTMMAVLPYGVFRRAKRYVQFASLVALLMLFFSVGAVTPEVKRLAAGEPTWASNLPSVWFVGVYYAIQGDALRPLAGHAPLAGYALAASLLLAIVAYALSYRWFFLRSAESTDVAMHALRFPDWAFRALDATVLRTAFDRACFRFVLKTLARSDRHTAVLTSLLGLGAALAVSNPGAVYVSSLVLIYSLLTGLRCCFGIPSDLRSNWVFQLSAEDEADPHGTVQRVMLLLASPLILATATLVATISGWSVALLHLLFVITATTLLIEFLTVDFRVIPFTCSWLPGAGNLVFSLALFMVGLMVFSGGMGGIEEFVLRYPKAYAIYLVFFGAAMAAFRHTRNSRERLIYHDTRDELHLLRIAE